MRGWEKILKILEDRPKQLTHQMGPYNNIYYFEKIWLSEIIILKNVFDFWSTKIAFIVLYQTYIL
jgi:hypothetical protein